jgi:CheY-like chemotaxis protein
MGQAKLVGNLQATPKVLCVDDDPIFLELMGLLMESKGISAVFATSGEAALQMLEDNHSLIMMLFVDLAMPAMSGYELAATIRNVPACANLPMVAVTARSKTEALSQAHAAGFDDVIPKPFAMSQILTVLERYGVLVSPLT